MLPNPPDKADLRRKMLQLRQALSDKEQKIASEYACAQVLKEISVSKGDIIGLYSPIRAEISPLPLIHSALHLNAQWALPKVEGAHIQYYAHTPINQLITGIFGIAEPCAGTPVIPSLILIPLLAFDSTGHRLGYGGGYFDRWASHPAFASVQRIGFAYDWQGIESLPRQAHDVRLHAVITDKRIIRFPQ